MGKSRSDVREAMNGTAPDPNMEKDYGVFGAAWTFARSRVSGNAANAHTGCMGRTFGEAGLRSQQAKPERGGI